MRLLEILLNGDFHLTNFPDDAIPPYAILSHTWGDESQEVTFEDIIRRSASEKEGYKKIRFCGEQAILDGLQYFWIDTCCIDKSNPVELSQAISAMFRWYRNAKQCYVYLSDVSDSPNEHDSQPWDSDFWKSRWFTRGWTLQELVAPHSVVFFSREGKRLGNKDSLKQQIHAITRVPMLALEGASLSQFSVEERFLWIKHRRTKLEEDMVYSLLGIFDIEMPLFYGEGAVAAFNRLREIIDKRAKCTQDLYTTDPRKDKLRIEESKGGLLMDSYYWILEHDDFKQWRNTNQSRLLWIKGDPGKGKTMMLCGIINELNKPYGRAQHLSYFFCQATDSRINDATAVLRGLLYLLVDQQPSIISHILRQHDHAGRNLFEDANAWVALSEIFISVLHDPGLQSGYMIIDGLDECVGDLPKLLDFIVQVTSEPSPIKWLVSSRNDANIERKLQSNNSGTRLSLELRENAEQVSNAVNAYIDRCLRDLPDIQSDNSLQDSIREKIRRKANGTFLWVSLVVKELKEAMSWEVLQLLDELPLELMGLYRRMMDHIKRLPRKYPELCLHVIKVVVAAYRPLHLRELHSLSSLPSHAQDIDQFTTSIVRMCGSFLTIKDDNVYIIHQSAKDFLCDAASYEVFPRGSSDAHYTLFSNSLRVLSRTLYRDMYGLCNPGYSITQVKQPEPDPLIASRYACIYWVDHLYDWSFGAEQIDELRDGGSVDVFIQKKFLYWLEALSICRSMPQGVIGMMKLKTLIQKRTTSSALHDLIHDARRFIMYNKLAIEISPLQAYVSALIFSPDKSLIKGHFKEEEPRWMKVISNIGEGWSPCLQTLEGHAKRVESIAFSHDSTQLASASADLTVRIWDADSGDCVAMLEGHSRDVNSVVYSHDSKRLASASSDGTVRFWNSSSGECEVTLEAHSNSIKSMAFSHDSTLLALASYNSTVRIWDVGSGECVAAFEGHSNSVNSVAFSHDSKLLASGSEDSTTRIWNAGSGDCVAVLKGHNKRVMSVAFSHDSKLLASASADRTVRIWDIGYGECLQTLNGHYVTVCSVAFSHDSIRLASASADRTIRIWSVLTGECQQILDGHSGIIGSVAFSHDSTKLASASWDRTVKIWDMSRNDSLQTLEGHKHSVDSVVFSYNSARLASGSYDSTARIWDASSGKCVAVLEGHRNSVNSVTFSHDSKLLASASVDRTVRIWDVESGDCVVTLEGHRSHVSSVAFSHDSTQLASASGDLTVRIWDTDSGDCVATLEGHSKSVLSVTFSHDSTRLASGSYDLTVRIWDTGRGECLRTLEGHNLNVCSLAFSHNSTRLASASADRTVRIWDAESGDCVATLEVGAVLNELSFDATGRYLRTDSGMIPVDISSEIAPSGVERNTTQYKGVGLSLDKQWITYDSKKYLWLPSEYRPCCSTIFKNMIGIGLGSGKLWICNVDLGSNNI